MNDAITIALDAMGGDHAPAVVVQGAELVRHRHPNVRFLLFGDEARIRPLFSHAEDLQSVSEIRHTDREVRPEDQPSQALRKGRDTSMRLAIDAVKSGEAQAAVSAGNTGALMAMAKFSLKTLPGIDRPAIASVVPTLKGEAVMLDLGANISCDTENLVQFALMGADFARAVLGREHPTVGLLNVGIEELKGNDTVKEAGERLRRAKGMPFEYYGFIEGDDITRGTVDVIVTDGFTGNVALKTAEGSGRLFIQLLRSVMQSTWRSRLALLLASRSLRILHRRIDPRMYNGGVFMGLNGVCVKSHGGTDATGFANAIGVAIDMATNNMIEKLVAEFRNDEEGRSTPQEANKRADAKAEVAADAPPMASTAKRM
jgi:glycerol-3-phosphate acyltransferase PlsX